MGCYSAVKVSTVIWIVISEHGGVHCSDLLLSGSLGCNSSQGFKFDERVAVLAPTNMQALYLLGRRENV